MKEFGRWFRGMAAGVTLLTAEASIEPAHAKDTISESPEVESEEEKRVQKELERAKKQLNQLQAWAREYKALNLEVKIEKKRPNILEKLTHTLPMVSLLEMGSSQK